MDKSTLDSPSVICPGFSEGDAGYWSLEPPNLSQWVESIWYSQGRLEALQERVLPAATCDIVANLGPAMTMVDETGPRRIVGTTTSGLYTRPFRLQHPTVHEALGVRVTPLGLHAILGVPASTLTDVTAQLPDVLDTVGDELAELCTESTSPWGALRVAVDWIRTRVRRYAENIDPLARWAVREIVTQHGTTTISDLVSQSGYGATRFNQRFTDELGLTPKRFARLIRFRRALDLLDPDIPLSDLALGLGYSDQAHMNRDFRTLGETTPSEVLELRYPSGITLAG